MPTSMRSVLPAPPICHMINLANTPAACFTSPMVGGEIISFIPALGGASGSPLRTPTAASNPARCTGPDQRLPQSCQQSRHAHRPATLRPCRPIHPDHKPPRWKRRPKQQHLQIFISSVILDRNSHVCVHNYMQTELLTKINRARRRARTLSQSYGYAST